MNSMIAGSMLPERVPITTPSSGVRPMVVSTHLPFTTALIEDPLPRWQTITFEFSDSVPGILPHVWIRSCGLYRGNRIFLLCSFLVFQWQTIQICFCRHGLMESGIKYCYLRYTWHQFAAYTDTDQVCRLCRGARSLHSSTAWITSSVITTEDANFFSAVYDTMSDCIYFFRLAIAPVFHWSGHPEPSESLYVSAWKLL